MDVVLIFPADRCILKVKQATVLNTVLDLTYYLLALATDTPF